MPCYCSFCYPVSDKINTKRKIKEHLKADENRLPRYKTSNPTHFDHLLSCIDRNRRFLETGISQNIDNDIDNSGSDGMQLEAENSFGGGMETEGGARTIAQGDHSNQFTTDSWYQGDSDTADVDMDSANNPDPNCDSDTSSIPSVDTLDPVSERWWDGLQPARESESDEESGAISPDELDLLESPLEGNQRTGVSGDSVHTSASNMDSGDEAFFDIPDSVKNLRAKLLGSYRLPSVPPSLPPQLRILSPSEIQSLQHFIAWMKSNGTVKAYKLHGAVLAKTSGIPIKPLSSVKKLAQTLIDFTPRKVDMCPKSCIAYTGSYAALEQCPYKAPGKLVCSSPRYRRTSTGRLEPLAQVQVLPVMATIRAMFANAETSRLLRSRDACLQKALHLVGTATKATKRYSDYGNGQIHIMQHERLALFKGSRDVAFALSTDGAQLTMKKQSNTWIMLLIILNLPGSIRYRTNNTIINFATPGPNSPGDIESFVWPMFEEMAQASEGIWLWDALDSSYFVHQSCLVMALGDMLGSAKMSGMAGHTAVFGDRFTEVEAAKSSLASGSKAQYYPLFPPDNARYNPGRPTGYDLANLPRRSQGKYWDTIEKLQNAKTKKDKAQITRSSGVSRLPLCAASNAFIHPTFFPVDPFHLFYENCMSYMWDLWTIRPAGDRIEKFHLTPKKAAEVGRLIPLAMETLPPAFCGAIRDPHLKRQSSYKVYEWMALLHWYIVPIAIELSFNPAVLHNFARFAEVIETAMTIQEMSDQDLEDLGHLIERFLMDFERLYVDGDPENIKRSRLCIFQLIHIPIHIQWNGSIRLGSQATVERSIGEAEHKIRSRKKPFANLINLLHQRELLKILTLYYPELDVTPSDTTPATSKLIQNHRIAWTKVGKNPRLLEDLRTMSAYLGMDVTARSDRVQISRWGKLKLLNGRTLSSSLSREKSRVTRRSEWFEAISPDSNDVAQNNLVFGEARAFYQVETSAGSQTIAIYTPLQEVEKVFKIPRGKWSLGTPAVIATSKIRDIVGIWNGPTTEKVYILRKHPGLEFLSTEEREINTGAEDSDDEE